jgi:hypothetical protein
MLQVWFLSWQTRVYARKPMPATPPGFFPQFIPDSNAPSREVVSANGRNDGFEDDGGCWRQRNEIISRTANQKKSASTEALFLWKKSG